MSRAWAHAHLRWRQLRRHPSWWATLLLLALAAAALSGARLGAVPVPVGEFLAAVLDDHHPLHRVVWEVRLPRVAVGAVAGAALAVAGTLLQTVVRNPLADPGLIGVNAGAGTAGLLAIIFAPERPLLLPLAAFAGAMVAVLLILLAAWGPGRRLGPLKIVLSGVAVQAVLASVVALLIFVFADRAPAFVAFMVGSLNGVAWSELERVAPMVGVGLTLAMAASRWLDLLLLDDASAAGVGLDVQRARLGASSIAALLAAAAVSVVGLVGFVGLVVPNWVRLVVGPEHRTALPLAAVGGATLTVLADLAARLLVPPLELPVGALLALLGGPTFLFILWRRLP